MALHWNIPNTPEHLLVFDTLSPEGKQEKTQHPVLHSLIWTSMILGGAPADLKPEDLARRFAVISRLDPDILTCRFGKGAEQYHVAHGDEGIVTFLDHWRLLGLPCVWDERREQWVVHLTPEGIRHWSNLSTNADRRPFRTWQARYTANVLREAGNGYRYKVEGWKTQAAEDLQSHPNTSNPVPQQ